MEVEPQRGKTPEAKQWVRMISLLLPYVRESIKVCLNAESLENDKEEKKDENKVVVANLYGGSLHLNCV